MRDQVKYVVAHAGPDDVIVVNLDSNWNFACYWPIGYPSRRPDTAVVQGYEAYFPGQPRIIVARSRSQAGVSAAMSQALARARQGCSRIWPVRSHVSVQEQAAWRTALRQDGLSATRAGHDGLRVIRLTRSMCR